MKVFLVMCGWHEVKRTVCRKAADAFRSRYIEENELDDYEVTVSTTTLEALCDRQVRINR